jgi:hypothetical protein
MWFCSDSNIKLASNLSSLCSFNRNVWLMLEPEPHNNFYPEPQKMMRLRNNIPCSRRAFSNIKCHTLKLILLQILNKNASNFISSILCSYIWASQNHEIRRNYLGLGRQSTKIRKSNPKKIYDIMLRSWNREQAGSESNLCLFFGTVSPAMRLRKTAV